MTAVADFESLMGAMIEGDDAVLGERQRGVEGVVVMV
jgi:hypothetical protein